MLRWEVKAWIPSLFQQLMFVYVALLIRPHSIANMVTDGVQIVNIYWKWLWCTRIVIRSVVRSHVSCSVIIYYHSASSSYDTPPLLCHDTCYAIHSFIFVDGLLTSLCATYEVYWIDMVLFIIIAWSDSARPVQYCGVNHIVGIWCNAHLYIRTMALLTTTIIIIISSISIIGVDRITT